MYAVLDGKDLPRAIDALADTDRSAASAPPEEDRPIFLLSAGWRSGSTLVQRLISSDPSVLMWGEPFGDHVPVHLLAQMIEPFTGQSAHLKCSIDQFEGRLSDQWIANLNPGVGALKAAHRAFFVRLFARVAVERGFGRWGCKWVRLTASHAYYLRWLFPSARFVFLVRHPLHALRSYRGQRWYLARPDHQVSTTPQFLRHWNATASSFVSHGEKLGALLVRYEDLIDQNNEALRRLSAHLSVTIDSSVLEKRIGRRETLSGHRTIDRLILKFRGGRACAALGYGLDGTVRPYRTDASWDAEDGRER